jgi:hypothetical protein
MREHFHNLQSKERMVLNQEKESLPVDCAHFGRLDGDRARAPRKLLDQRHLTDHSAGFDAFENRAVQADLDLAFDDDVHALGRFIEVENRGAGSESFCVRVVVPEYIQWVHGQYNSRKPIPSLFSTKRSIDPVPAFL